MNNPLDIDPETDQILESEIVPILDCQPLENNVMNVSSVTDSSEKVYNEKGFTNTKCDGEYGTLERDSNEEPKKTFISQNNDELLPNPEKPIDYFQQILEEKPQTKQLEEKQTKMEELIKDLHLKLEQITKQKNSAVKEKEMMVVRFAVAEKNVLKEKSQKEAAEKKCKEATRENELLQHKIQTMVSEKARICQLLDDKCYEHKTTQQELECVKGDLISLETKLKWAHTSLKTEMENRKDAENKLLSLNAKLQEMTSAVEQSKLDAEESVKTFHRSEENRAFVLDQQIQEQQAAMILFRHEKKDKEEQIKILRNELQRLQSKQKDMLQENNDLSLKVQQLERERSETEQKLSELRGCADQQRQNFADLQTKTVQLEQLKLQMKHEQDQLLASNEQMSLLKKRNLELESDMEYCRNRESELLLFTQQLTDKNVRLQSEFTSMETKVQQLTCQETLLRRQIKEQETRSSIQTDKLSEEIQRQKEEIEDISKNFKNVSKLCDLYKQQLTDLKGENALMKRKYEMSVRVIQPDVEIDKQTLIEHIVKLQRLSAKKSEKIDFLEEHVNTLVIELQKKSKLLQSYILREQSGTLTSDKMDSNKAKLAKHNGVMASLYSSRVADDNLTLELSLDINRKLQAVLEDALLKNITLKENVDTLGSEIEKLNKLRT
ncbi:coiled-coil domain-containing protein 186 isoform X2 [Leptinotarsa decemlineata]|uniref:coiled-coil domain-containing protein 186 isoform X2 n=1 Tax=Leptinotarsa decemlineata TaxID=7539 RepID=UPI003D30B8B9